MKRSFALNTEPHEAEIGDTVLKFQPEVYGDAFLDAYSRLRESQAAAGVDIGDLGGVDPEALRQVTASLRVFLAGLMLPESAEVFARWEVQMGGKTVGEYGDPGEAKAAAAVHGAGACVVFTGMQLPDRVMVELLEWVVELYGGGGNRPPTSSGVSARASQRAGTPGRAPSRSRA